MTRSGGLCSTRTMRRRVLPLATRRARVMGAPRASSGAASMVSSMCWTMWTENNTVSRLDRRSRATARTPIPARKEPVRWAGQATPLPTRRRLAWR